MSSAIVTRPPWLYKEQELEQFIETHSLSMNILELRRSRNGCRLVSDVLDKIVSKQNINPPGEWEMNLARIHLAVDLQNILKRWCGIGLQKTLEGSTLRDLFSSEIVSDLRHPVELEARTKLEVMSPPSVFSKVQHSRFQYEAEDWHSCRPYADSRVISVPQTAQSFKRPLENVDHYQEVKCTKVAKTEFKCPYYARDPQTHTECSNKTFPNPRKLK